MAESPKFSRHWRNRGWGTRWWRQILDRKWKYGLFAHAQWKICNITLIYGRIAEIFASFRKSGSGNTMVMSDFSPEVEIRPFRACAMYPAIIIGTVRSLWTWTWLWGRYHVPQNAFLVYGWIAQIFVSFRKSGSGNTIVTSDFSPEVEIRPFRACAMKNMQYNPYLWLNCPNFRLI